MMRHALKCWPESFEALWGGLKSYEIRKTDRNYQVGDSLQIMEWIAGGMDGLFGGDYYTGRVIGANVIHITRGVHGLPSDLCVMQLQVFDRCTLDKYKVSDNG